jgi:hypothetical protein
MPLPTIAQPTTPAAPTRERLALATAMALVVAALLLVGAVLPAEYGIDPLGTGKALGLLELFEASAGDEISPLPPPGEATPLPRVFKTESTHFTLGPGQGFEYKYRIEQGGGMVYTWSATGKMKYEFHGDPDGISAIVLSYEKGEADFASGSFVASAAGIHGWYWENVGSAEATITLTSAGFYSAGDEMRPKWDPVKHKNRIEHIPHELAEVKPLIPSP